MFRRLGRVLNNAGFEQVGICRHERSAVSSVLNDLKTKAEGMPYFCNAIAYKRRKEVVIDNEKYVLYNGNYDIPSGGETFLGLFCTGEISKDFEQFESVRFNWTSQKEFRKYLKSSRGVENSGNSAVL